MTNLIELLEEVCFALRVDLCDMEANRLEAAIAELKEAKPVAWMNPVPPSIMGGVSAEFSLSPEDGWTPLYTSPVAPVERPYGTEQPWHICPGCSHQFQSRGSDEPAAPTKPEQQRDPCQVPQCLRCGGNLYDCGHMQLVKPNSATKPEQSEDARDAARYRWLRDGWGSRPTLQEIYDCDGGKELDAKLDAAISKEGK
jgi:hypothetical protein